MPANLRGAAGTKERWRVCSSGAKSPPLKSSRPAETGGPGVSVPPGDSLIPLSSTVGSLLPVLLFLPQLQRSGLCLNKGWRGGLRPPLSANFGGAMCEPPGTHNPLSFAWPMGLPDKGHPIRPNGGTPAPGVHTFLRCLAPT